MQCGAEERRGAGRGGLLISVPSVTAQRDEITSPPKRRSQRSVGASEARQEKPKAEKKERKPRVPEATVSSGLFETATAHQRYDAYLRRQFIDERGESDIKNLDEVREMLDGINLLSYVEDLGPYAKELVCEFRAHLLAVKNEEESVQVWVKGVYYDFSPDAINKTLQSQTLTNDEHREFMYWNWTHVKSPENIAVYRAKLVYQSVDGSPIDLG
ncbi:unnamed protein product [Cochlearia groenlandica]